MAAPQPELAYTLVPLIGVLFILFPFFVAKIGDSPGFFRFEFAIGLFLVGSLYVRLRWKRC